jgi:hypothetical protein
MSRRGNGLEQEGSSRRRISVGGMGRRGRGADYEYRGNGSEGEL